MNYEKIIDMFMIVREYSDDRIYDESTFDKAIAFLRARASEPSAQEIREFCEKESYVIYDETIAENYTIVPYERLLNFIDKSQEEKK